MSFAEIPEFESTFKPTEYVKLISGVPIQLRVLDEIACHVEKHFLPTTKISVLCLGEETCPICEQNQDLIKQNEDVSPRQIRGFLPRQNRYMVNVLNRTVVKVSPSGNVVYPVQGQFPTNDPQTGELLVNIESKPLDKVQVLERGPTLFAQLNAINDTVVDPETGNPIGLWKYDIVIAASGSGRKMTTNVIPYPNMDDEVSIPDEEKYALETLGIQLSPEEMMQAVRGVSLRDIFEARRATDNALVSADAQVISEDVQGKIETLFPQ
jgi:hypothetical protein